MSAPPSISAALAWLRSLLPFAPPPPTPTPTVPYLDPSNPSKYRLDDSTSSRMTLSDGRTLGYAEYGSDLATARVIFFLHGLPGSRMEASYFEDIGKDVNARIIGIDRPGHGWSSPMPQRRILDHPKDIVALAKYLSIEKFAVIGVSGGGPYALACSYALPADTLVASALICGLGPPDIGMADANFWNWTGFTFGWRYLPWLVRIWMIRNPGAQLHLSYDQRLALLLDSIAETPVLANDKDREVYANTDMLRMSLKSNREAFSQGFDGALLDGKLDCMDFQFKVEDIRKDLPVHLWYGSLDTFVPPVHGKQIKARIGDSATLNLVEETHASVFFACKRKAIEGLLEAWDRERDLK